MEYTIRTGGQAGQGLQTIGSVLAKLFARSGFQVFTHQDYMSRIRGGHNYYQVRFADHSISSSRSLVDILIALDRTTVEEHRDSMTPGGLIVYDPATVKEKYGPEGFLEIPFRQIAMDTAGNRLMENTVAVGAIMGMLGMELQTLEELLTETFVRKGREVVDQNISAAKAGSDFARKNCGDCAFDIAVTPPAGAENNDSGASAKTDSTNSAKSVTETDSASPASSKKMLLDGTVAVGLGALISGCRFYSAYPMTPSTGVMNFMADQSRKHSLVVEQAEDEIAAINMAIGASYAGVRSMTGTAGGGYALMVEGLSLAAMTETPVVIFVGQRPAPATGFPTRTEQGDLLNLAHSSHGEFPRVILAPGSPEQAFYLTGKAFDLAEKYQVPAFILSDQYLADTEWTLDGLDAGGIPYHDYRLRAGDLEKVETYRRHAYTESGVSPMAEPGASRHLVVTDSDEHDEDGHLVEDAETRNRMVDKRLLRKLPLLRDEISPPLLHGNEHPETVICCWGSNYGVVMEAVDRLGESENIAMLHFSEILPFPGTKEFDYLHVLREAKKTVCVENNATSQFAHLMRAETGFVFGAHVNKYDGRPFMLDELLDELRKVGEAHA
ncbi:MAG: 2-oxoacid:acceptor oxidoreductase subunit alpha [Thermoleophilia bacterium]|nr:2-oxoacid:acceptor oxidoreductase subunit alpha [Thermoleophilia bacterium]